MENRCRKGKILNRENKKQNFFGRKGVLAKQVVFFMAEEIPRRMKRFYRQGSEQKSGFSSEKEVGGVSDYLFEQMPKDQPKQGADKDVTMHLTLQEVRKFKDEHKRYPEKAEYDQIAENIFQQLKDKDVKGQAGKPIWGRRGREAIEGKKETAEGDEKEWSEFEEADKQIAGQPQKDKAKELASLSVEDIFAEEKKGAQSGAQKEEGDEFSLGELGEAEQQCPKCAKPASKVVFCPECGTAFCYSCAKKVEKIGSIETVVCPDCGKKFSQ